LRSMSPSDSMKGRDSCHGRQAERIRGEVAREETWCVTCSGPAWPDFCISCPTHARDCGLDTGVFSPPYEEQHGSVTHECWGESDLAEGPYLLLLLLVPQDGLWPCNLTLIVWPPAGACWWATLPAVTYVGLKRPLQVEFSGFLSR